MSQTRTERRDFIQESIRYLETPGQRLRAVARTLIAITLQDYVFTNFIDISHWNPTFSFDDMVDAGFLAVYAKATEGTHFVDSDFQDNTSRAMDAGAYVGAYVFDRSNVSPIDQIDHFLETTFPLYASGYDKILPPMIDKESRDGQSQATIVTRLNQGVDYLTQQLKKPLFYTSPYFWNSNIDDAALASKIWGFVANWTGSPLPAMPRHWTEDMRVAWQWCVCPRYLWCNNRPFPYEGEMDLDRFFGTETRLREWAGISIPGDCNCEEELAEVIAWLNALDDLMDETHTAISSLYGVTEELTGIISSVAEEVDDVKSGQEALNTLVSRVREALGEGGQ